MVFQAQCRDYGVWVLSYRSCGLWEFRKIQGLGFRVL